MPRIRSVHPGLFTDEQFMELTVSCPIAIPLLLGLWCEADDFGAFEWKPVVLKARYLPATGENAAALLDRLAELNFVRRYDVNGRFIGVVRNFLKYQRPKSPRAQHPASPAMRIFAGEGDWGRPSEIEGDEVLPFPPKGEIAPQMEDGGGRKEEESSSSARGGAGGDRGPEIDPGPQIDLGNVVPLGRDPVEAECRAVLAGLPVAIAVDFGPMREQMGRPVNGTAERIGRGDLLAGCVDAAAKAGRDFRPTHWGQIAGWARKAAEKRVAANFQARAGPGPRSPPTGKKKSGQSVLIAMMRGEYSDGCDDAAGSGFAGPQIDGRAVAACERA
jgi:hypothetical protein